MLSTAGVPLVIEENVAQSGSSDSQHMHGAKKTTTVAAGSVFEQNKQKVSESDHASASRFSLLHKKLITSVLPTYCVKYTLNYMYTLYSKLFQFLFLFSIHTDGASSLVSKDVRVMPGPSSAHHETKPLTTAKANEKYQAQLLANSFKTLIPIAEEWANIGTMLALSQEDLDSIAEGGGNDKDHLHKMLRLWLSQIDNPSDVWQSLAEAVEAFDSKIAEKLQSHLI